MLKIYLELFWGFLKVGCFSFGGAYAAIPLIQEVVMSYGWLSHEMISYMVAVSESTPGPIMVNMATYVGSTQAGLAGSACATLAVILPAFLIILFIMRVLDQTKKNRYVKAAMEGMKPCMIGIILSMGVTFLMQNIFGDISLDRLSLDHLDLKSLLGTALLLIIFYGSQLLKRKLSPFLLIILSAFLGILIF